MLQQLHFEIPLIEPHNTPVDIATPIRGSGLFCFAAMSCQGIADIILTNPYWC
jgi:hypothetical protein